MPRITALAAITAALATATVGIAIQPAVAAGTTINQYASSASGSRYNGASGRDDWAPWQATGAPNTKTCGDQTTAWASSTGVRRAETLVVGFAKAVVASQMKIWVSTPWPRSLVKVEANVGTSSKPAWTTVFSRDAKAPLTTGAMCTKSGNAPVPHTLTKDNATFPRKAISQVRLTLDETVSDWAGEIDAVQLTGRLP